MEINNSMNVSGLNGSIPPERAVTAAKSGSADSASFAGSSALQGALSALPDSRPDAVERARQLISDPTYPSPQAIRQLSQFLVSNLANQ